MEHKTIGTRENRIFTFGKTEEKEKKEINSDINMERKSKSNVPPPSVTPTKHKKHIAFVSLRPEERLKLPLPLE
jgi:hypothetical protein